MADILLDIDVEDSGIVQAVQNVKRLESNYKLLDRAFNTGKIGAQQYAKGISQVDAAIDAAWKGQTRYNFALEASQKGYKRASLFAQQAGYQIGDFAVQVQSGTSGLVALSQQGSQMLGFLGPLGALAGAGLAIYTAILRANQEVSNMTFNFQAFFKAVGSRLDSIAPLIKAISNAADAVGNTLTKATESVINNLDRAIVYAVTAATAFGVRFVGGLVAAKVATISLSNALVFLRGALIRTGIGALIVGAGELAYWFTRGVQSLGGFGNALSHFGKIAKASFDSAGAAIRKFYYGISESVYDVVSSGLKSILDLTRGFEDGLTYIGSFTRGLVGGIKATWEALPQAITNVGIKMSNGFIGGLESIVGAAKRAVNSVLEAFNEIVKFVGADKAAEYFGFDLTVGGFENIGGEFEGWKREVQGSGKSLGDTFTEAFNSAVTQSTKVTVGEQGGLVSRLIGSSDALKIEARLKKALAAQDLDAANAALKELVDQLKEGTEEGIKFSDFFTKVEEKAEAAKKKMTELDKERKALVESIEGSMESALMSIADGTKSVTDAFRVMARDIIAELYRVLVVKRMVSGITSLFGFADGGAFQGGSQIQAYADGGVVGGPTFFPMAGGKTGLMGEAGPEAIMPLKRGKDGKLGVSVDGRSSGDTINVNQTINVSTGVQQTVRTEIKSLMPQISDAAKSAVMEAKRRGGSYGRSF